MKTVLNILSIILGGVFLLFSLGFFLWVAFLAAFGVFPFVYGFEDNISSWFAILSMVCLTIGLLLVIPASKSLFKRKQAAYLQKEQQANVQPLPYYGSNPYQPYSPGGQYRPQRYQSGTNS
ncbi:hypothetical protein BSR29_00905 [Boudabousia liubingyangii]|uniref:Uncharacterized protein n=1 Tax=Boudabousia liubingyangii TaxID=1921764 RepID=A0A1Q5PPL9_9ACTO|nr:hypothetical protein BSR29_00905 [Boudabousia liubingyangii]